MARGLLIGYEPTAAGSGNHIYPVVEQYQSGTCCIHTGHIQPVRWILVWGSGSTDDSADNQSSQTSQTQSVAFTSSDYFTQPTETIRSQTFFIEYITGQVYLIKQSSGGILICFFTARRKTFFQKEKLKTHEQSIHSCFNSTCCPKIMPCSIRWIRFSSIRPHATHVPVRGGEVQ